MKKSSRALALLLCLVMVVALMPTFAIDAKAASTFYGGGATAGAYTTDTTWFGKETLDNPHLLQYVKTANGNETMTDRHALNYTKETIDLTKTVSSRTRDVFLIPYNSGTLYLDRNNNSSYNFLQKHLTRTAVDTNRWWRWSSWSGSNSEWTDDYTTAGFFGRIFYRHALDAASVNTYWDNVSKNTVPKYSWESYEWTGGNDTSAGNYFELKINANENLPVGSTAVLWSANGTRLNNNGTPISSIGTYDFIDHRYVDNGAISTYEFAVAEPKEVVYELNGGEWADAPGAKNVGYVCWSANNKLYSQLHDIMSEPSREGYVFLGWECISTENNATVSGVTIKRTNKILGNVDRNAGLDEYSVGNGGTALEVGKVYQPVDAKGNKTTLTVLGNVVFRAKWIKEDFTIEHVQNGAVVGALTETVPLTTYGEYVVVAYNQAKQYQPTTKLDITSKVSDGKLYGGTFKSDFTTVADFNGGKAQSFDPKGGETYYIWEVSNEHLNPKTICTWQRADGLYDVKNIFLLTAVDRTLYSEVGFTVNSEDISAKDGDVVAYKTVHIDKANADFTYYQLVGADTTQNSYLACKEITGYEANKNYTVTPYWVTLDGVEVTGPATRVFQYQGPGKSADYQKLLIVSDPNVPSNVKSVAAAPAPLMLMSCFYSSSSNALDVNDEYVPEEPEVPDIPDEPEVPESAVINVVDGENAYEAEIIDGAVALIPAGADGKLFAGWFTDEACTVPTDLAAVNDGDTVYAKYVSIDFLQVKFNPAFTLFNKSVSLTAAVADKNFAETGFVIKTKNGTDTVVVSSYTAKFALQNAQQLFGVAKDSPLMTVDYKISGLSKGDIITVTPYWVTADGTTVYGNIRTMTYTGLTVKG